MGWMAWTTACAVGAEDAATVGAEGREALAWMVRARKARVAKHAWLHVVELDRRMRGGKGCCIGVLFRALRAQWVGTLGAI